MGGSGGGSVAVSFALYYTSPVVARRARQNEFAFLTGPDGAFGYFDELRLLLIESLGASTGARVFDISNLDIITTAAGDADADTGEE